VPATGNAHLHRPIHRDLRPCLDRRWL
jgi:hypothetical protein